MAASSTQARGSQAAGESEATPTASRSPSVVDARSIPAIANTIDTTAAPTAAIPNV